jgi:aminoglycoside phosphotransferase (APT) family kinase protein
MRLVAAGRASEIFDLGDGRVLRRFTSGGDPEREAAVMEHARRHGYPVPAVLGVSGDAIVLERVEGPTMSADLRRRPWRLRSHAALLVRLHGALHELDAPPGLARLGSGDRLLHLDLHPENVMLSPAGPVVIDWTNARVGDPAVDVALSWVILATSGGRGGRLFLRSFLPHFERVELVRALPAAAEYRLADPNVTGEERDAVRRLREKQAVRPSGTSTRRSE